MYLEIPSPSMILTSLRNLEPVPSLAVSICVFHPHRTVLMTDSLTLHLDTLTLRLAVIHVDMTGSYCLAMWRYVRELMDSCGSLAEVVVGRCSRD
jgi:hypothetical protein